MSQKDPKLSYEIYIAAPAARVWSALTDGALTEQYFYGTRVESAFEAGAPIAYAAGGARMVEGEVLAVDRGTRLTISQRATWDEKVAADPASRVAWELAPMGDATRLGLVHDGFGGETETYRQSAAGWPLILSSLKTLLETGRPLVLATPGTQG
jgi:uncharacterized protein YndB with AHSA1/START domain